MADDPAALVLAARDGDQAAWNGLVDRYAGLGWAIARAFGLDRTDAADVNQMVWLRLVEQLDRLREPDRVGAWIAAVTRNECRRVLRRSGRELPTEHDPQQADHRTESPDMPLLREERHAALWDAFDQLPDRCRTLLRLLMAEPRPAYAEIAAALDVPIGYIGPTRQRCLDRLRRMPGLRITWEA